MAGRSGRHAGLAALLLLSACHGMGGPGYRHMAGSPARMGAVMPGMTRDEVAGMLGPGHDAGPGAADCDAYMVRTDGPYRYMHVWYRGDVVDRLTRGTGPACPAI
ncbi:hypothetical protein [Mangrovicoccus sp. HB161399]|uniref:hypothetical protein n=1 Tax=Mangrovicoccus sp. HB161399 TaxID=2720392 RepID=UPI0015558293|nr:hypothetical protein [Mangrovicoccus sp. HB161399]